MNRPRAGRLIRWVGLGFGVVLVAIQFVPYGWSHPNTAVIRDAPWPDAEAERITRSSCYACHSNETDWPVYAYVAPMSWLVRSDVERGREEFNFSTWDRDGDKADDAIEEILEGTMPPNEYTWIHRDATLTDDEMERLVAALEALDEDDRGDGGRQRPDEDDARTRATSLRLP